MRADSITRHVVNAVEDGHKANNSLLVLLFKLLRAPRLILFLLVVFGGTVHRRLRLLLICLRLAAQGAGL